ncbi:helix-turn-helix domain-containing protein [Bradyrhizobium cajani]|uniref:Helix-turn-helix domain-containing protein n=2 Tax=Bradyrhizobium cajani TaxID=1928661 RepID=A0A844TFN9_9BRAD|nr:helix-turn-helix domain-containing protein [Bradyrhizobium cajani]
MSAPLEGDISQVVGQRIREARKAAGLSLEVMAQSVGISVPQLSKLENGKSTATIRSLAKIGLELQRPPNYFLQSDQQMARCLGTLVPSWDTEGRAIEKFAELVGKRTGSRVTVAVFPAAQLGSAATQIQALMNGVLDLFAESIGFFERFSQPLRLASLPFCFVSETHYERFQTSKLFNTDVRDTLRAKSVELLNANWKWGQAPSVVLISKKLITSPDELKGLRVRCPENETFRAYLERLGCEPVVVPWAKVEATFQADQIDAMISKLSHVVSMRFTRYARFMTQLDYRPLDLSFAINRQLYQMLSPALQDGLNQAAAEAGQYCINLMTQTADQLPRLLNEDGAVLVQAAAGPWHARSMAIFDDLERAGCWDRGLVAEFRALANN